MCTYVPEIVNHSPSSLSQETIRYTKAFSNFWPVNRLILKLKIRPMNTFNLNTPFVNTNVCLPATFQI